jgi:hypothetical protein
MIFKLINDLKIQAINTMMCSMASFGDISLYDDKSTIAYPYINFDVVTSFVTKSSLKTYTIRVYVCDRNEPYIAYNKAEMILDTLMNTIDVAGYTTNYFTLNFKDQVNGVWADFQIEDIIEFMCAERAGEVNYVVLENGDIINKKFVLTEENELYVQTEE